LERLGRPDELVVGGEEYLDTTALGRRQVKSIQIPEALASQFAPAPAHVLRERDSLRGSLAKQLRHPAPLLVGALRHLEQEDVRGDPFERPGVNGPEEMLDSFGLKPDADLTLIVERPAQSRGIEINPPRHDEPSL
jgi:hypothetical protein